MTPAGRPLSRAPRYSSGVPLNHLRLRRALGLAVLIVAAACGRDTPTLAADTTLPDLPTRGGPDAVLLRVPVDGGTPSAYRWPDLDQAAWTAADKTPPLRRLLAFDASGGILAIEDTAGHAVRLDLRTGRVFTGDVRLTGVASADGWTIFGVAGGRVQRVTPSGLWRGPTRTADDLFPLPNGDVLVATHGDLESQLVRLRPPDPNAVDSTSVPRILKATRTVSGDRWYLETAEGLLALESRTLTRGEAPPEDAIRALAVTPSGDRVFTLSTDGRQLRVWERYAARTAATLNLTAAATALRMDPLGRFVVIRDEVGDSIRVLSVPLLSLVGVLSSAWRDDLPAVMPDGAVLTAEAKDVVVRDPQLGTERARIAGGASDRWLLVPWDGFRPRDRALDAPVTFDSWTPADSAAEAEAVDSLLAASAREARAEVLDASAQHAAAPPIPDDSAAAVGGYTLAFASLLSESRARALADRLRVDGRPPRVVVSTSEGATIYRVVSGPYPTREAAEAAGRRSGVSFWVFVGLP